MRVKNKGFTLIELLASIVILGIIFVFALPQIVGVVSGNRNKMYVEDAKKDTSETEVSRMSDMLFVLVLIIRYDRRLFACKNIVGVVSSDLTESVRCTHVSILQNRTDLVGRKIIIFSEPMLLNKVFRSRIINFRSRFVGRINNRYGLAFCVLKLYRARTYFKNDIRTTKGRTGDRATTNLNLVLTSSIISNNIVAVAIIACW